MPRHGPPRGGGHGGPAGGVQPRHQARVRHPLHRGRHHGRGRELRVEGPGRTGGQVRDQLVWFECHPGDIPARLDQIAFVQIVSVPPPPRLPTPAHPTAGAALCRHQPRHQLGLGTRGRRSISLNLIWYLIYFYAPGSAFGFVIFDLKCHQVVSSKWVMQIIMSNKYFLKFLQYFCNCLFFQGYCECCRGERRGSICLRGKQIN